VVSNAGEGLQKDVDELCSRFSTDKMDQRVIDTASQARVLLRQKANILNTN